MGFIYTGWGGCESEGLDLWDGVKGEADIYGRSVVSGRGSTGL